MPRLLAVLILSIAASAVQPASAFACSFPIRRYSDREITEMAQRAIASATTIVDGEVISPMAIGSELPEGALPVAYIKVLRTWKGKVEDDMAPVAYVSSCDLGLETKGQKIRVLLSGQGIFTADQENNGRHAVQQREAFDRQVDRILGAPRPADFTAAGTPPP